MTDASDALARVLEQVTDPETGRPIAHTGQVIVAELTEREVCVVVGLTSWSAPIAEEWRMKLADRLTATFPGRTVEVEIKPFSRPVARSGQLALRIRSIVLVGSGKGGVGKSTIAASLALALQKLGARTGLMDADVYGPSIPHLLGLRGRPNVTEQQRIVPIQCGAMPVISMGFLVEPDQAVIWRGPMLHGSITQFLRDTEWGELDYLVIDMPPGTGDVALTLSQLAPIAGAVVVCTPQEVALLDAVKAIAMFRRVNIPILGMVENMSGFVSPDSGKRFDIFGAGGARARAEELGVPVLGEVPIDISLRERGDEGRLAAALEPAATSQAVLVSIARAVVRCLADRHAARPAAPTLPTL
jgi:ATP-binding protein involved in chromosome partitioning